MLAMMLLASSSTGASDAAAGGIVCFSWVCAGIFGLAYFALFVLWIIMLVDCVQRQEVDFPNSSGNSKTIWLVVLLVVGLLFQMYWVSLIYYFLVKKRAGKKVDTTIPPAPPV
jgi:hypothetical protein